MAHYLPQGFGAPSRFATDIFDLLDRVQYRRMSFSEDLEALYRFRYDAYRREGSIEENAERRCTDYLDEVPNVHRIGLYLDGDLVASMRVHKVTKAMPWSAGMSAFPDLLGPLLDMGMTIIDPSRFTVDDEVAKDNPGLPYLTVRIAAMASEHFNADYTMAVARPAHGAFYRRVFKATQSAEAHAYKGLTFPTALFAADVESIKDETYRRFPFFLSTEWERRIMFGEQHSDLPPLTVTPTARVMHELAMLPQEPQPEGIVTA